MKNATFLGIDIGTTGAKAMLISEEGRILASAQKAYPLIAPRSGCCEQNAADWWEAVLHTVKNVCKSPETAESVQAISLSTQGGTLVPTDARFNPLANAIVWSDTRCIGDRADALHALGEGYVYRASGWDLTGGLPLMQIRRMRSETPDIFAQTAYFLTVHDYITAKLTGRPAIDISNAGINQLVNISEKRYDDNLLNFAGVDESKLAALIPSCEPIGKLTKQAAAELGLSESTLVVSGAHDQYAVAFGAGICESGDAVIGTGTAWVVTALGDAPDFESGYSQSVSASAGRWGTMLSITTGGVCLDWFRNQVAGAVGSPLGYDELNELASRSDTPGANGLRFYPYLSGAGQPEPNASCRAALLGLDLSHDCGHIARAIMEGVACQMVWALRKLESRRPVRRLFLAGGATKSELWTRILAEIAGRPLCVSGVADLACVGAAMMAGVGCGAFRDTAEAVKRVRLNRRDIEPDAGRVQAYAEVFDDYIRGARALYEMHKTSAK